VLLSKPKVTQAETTSEIRMDGSIIMITFSRASYQIRYSKEKTPGYHEGKHAWMELILTSFTIPSPPTHTIPSKYR